MTTIHDRLTDAKGRIAPVSASASLDAQLLLAEVIGKDRAYVMAHSEKTLAPEQIAQYEAWVARRADGEPIAYILGRKAFYDREFIVTPAVLIPRPETEHLLELALAFMREHPHVTVVDVGTGSGALAVTLAANAPQASVYATDISPGALEIAAINAGHHDAQISFFQGDLLIPMIERGIRVDLVMANLPYVATGDWQNLAVSRHEPRLALDGGPEGLDFIHRLLEQSPNVLRPGGLVLLEIGADQGRAVSQLAQKRFAATPVQIYQDYAGMDRVVAIRF